MFTMKFVTMICIVCDSQSYIIVYFGGNKVSMLAHTYPHTNPEGRFKWPYASQG